MILFSSELDQDDKLKASSCFIANGKQIISVNGIKYGLSEKQMQAIKKVHKKIKIKSTILSFIKGKKHIVKRKDGEIPIIEKQRLFKLDQRLSLNKSSLAKLIRINFYAELELNGKVESLIRSILNTEYMEEFFELEPILKEQLVQNFIIDVLLKLKEKYDDQNLVETLVTYLSYGVSQDFRSKLKDEFEIPDRLSYIQNKIQSYNYALKFPFAWGLWIEKYSSRQELAKYMEKTMLYEQLAQNKIRYLGALRSYFPLDKELRKSILTAYRQLQKTSNKFEQDLLFRLEDNQSFSQYLIKNKVKTKPIFVERRKFFKKQILENNNLMYSLYNLLKLGDLKEEYFIIALALKSYEI